MNVTESERLRSNIEALAAYTAQHPELRSAHHFLYDLRCPANGQPQFVVMGINPGETAHDWSIAPEPTEETSRYDFHDVVGRGRSSIRWSKAAEFYLDGADYVLAELFFWSSRDGTQFRERFGSLRASKHLSLCARMNVDLIEAYSPKAVVLPGLRYVSLCSSLYGLRHEHSLRVDGHRIVEHYTDGTRPWVFTKHWTGSFGLSNEQRVMIRDHVRSQAQPERPISAGLSPCVGRP